MSVSVALEKAARQAGELREQTVRLLGQSLVGMSEPMSQILIALVSGGHALLEGVPGTAKTTLCRKMAVVLGLEYSRIQFTPDLLPSDVTGTKIFDQGKADFVLKTGPVFCQFLLADELNRAPARTQSALLEAMQERQVTIEGESLTLPQPFIVLATQNPVEQEGVYRLPEAQLDRFLFRIRVGYPERDDELELLEFQEQAEVALAPLWDAERISKLQQQVDAVFGVRELKEYVIDLARASRQHADVLLGASPRAAIFLLRAARARALLNGETYFTHEDVQAVVHPVFEHRLIIKPEAELSGRSIEVIIDEIINSVPVRTP